MKTCPRRDWMDINQNVNKDRLWTVNEWLIFLSCCPLLPTFLVGTRAVFTVEKV